MNRRRYLYYANTSSRSNTVINKTTMSTTCYRSGRIFRALDLFFPFGGLIVTDIMFAGPNHLTRHLYVATDFCCRLGQHESRHSSRVVIDRRSVCRAAFTVPSRCVRWPMNSGNNPATQPPPTGAPLMLFTFNSPQP